MLYLPSTYGELLTAPEDMFAYPGQREGLVGAWWAPERGGSKLFDLSGNNNHGTLTNGPTWVVGPYGYGLQFAGESTDYINIANDPGFSGSPTCTIIIWATVDTLAGLTNRVLFYYAQNTNLVLRMMMRTNDNLRWSVWTGLNVNVDTTAPSLGLSQYVLRYDGANAQIWVNGAFVVETAQTGSLYNGGTFSFCGIGGDTSSSWPGAVFHAAFYLTALTPAEILQDYLAGPGAPFILRDDVVGLATAAAGTTIPIFHHHYTQMKVA